MITFKQFSSDFKSAWGASATGLVASPLVLSFINVAPPVDGIAPASTALIVMMLAAVYAFISDREKQPALRRWGPRLCLLAPVAFLSYMVVWSFFTYKLPENQQNVFIGCGYLRSAAEIARLIKAPENGCPGEFEQLLLIVNDDPTRVWIRASIVGVEILTLALWLIFLAASTIGVSSILGLSIRQKSSRRIAQKGHPDAA
jgi:amino acid transporter